MLGAPHTLWAPAGSDGTLSVASDSCTPRAGRYSALIDGSPTTVTVGENGSMTAVELPVAREIEVSFLERVR